MRDGVSHDPVLTRVAGAKRLRYPDCVPLDDRLGGGDERLVSGRVAPPIDRQVAGSQLADPAPIPHRDRPKMPLGIQARLHDERRAGQPVEDGRVARDLRRPDHLFGAGGVGVVPPAERLDHEVVSKRCGQEISMGADRGRGGRDSESLCGLDLEHLGLAQEQSLKWSEPCDADGSCDGRDERAPCAADRGILAS
jgi:hypothetical protein